MSSRLPRFRRVTSVGPIQLTQRDQDIIRLVHQHRFLRSSQIVTLLGGSAQAIIRRLPLLYHHGYLERPRAQLQYYERGGSKSIVYGLSNKGGTLLRKEFGLALRPQSWGEKNRSVGRIFLEHALLVSEIMVALELACRKQGEARLLQGHELASDRPLRWQVTIEGHRKLGIVPDRVFALELHKPDGRKERIHFFLEADRGTMPVKRQQLSQTSFHRKLLAYEATWRQQRLKKDFGIQRFRVLTVTTSASRVKSLVDTCSQLQHGHRLFLFADSSIVSGDILTSLWQSGKPGETGRLLD